MPTQYIDDEQCIIMHSRSKKNTIISKDILVQMIKMYTITEAASMLCVCKTTLKKHCRLLGIDRWPNKNHKSVEDKINRLEFDILYNELGLNEELDDKILKECPNKDP